MSNYTHDNATAPGIALAHTVYGEPVMGSMRPEMAGEGTSQVAGNIMAPYKKPVRRHRDNGKALCASEGCRAWPMKGGEHCVGHARSLGLIENWNRDGRPNEPE